MDVKGVAWKNEDWIYLAVDRDQAFMNTAINFQVA
jgi:hypothetical protein